AEETDVGQMVRNLVDILHRFLFIHRLQKAEGFDLALGWSVFIGSGLILISNLFHLRRVGRLSFVGIVFPTTVSLLLLPPTTATSRCYEEDRGHGDTDQSVHMDLP